MLFVAYATPINMEETHSSETDPPEIRRRLECIQGQRALIDDLATRLKAAQLECDRMETELKEYRASIAPIRKCPEEVLLMIFECFSKAAPELVAGLLEVCKRWRDIAANAPRLWTHIRIKIEPTWDQRKAAREDAAMIETYLQHSGSLPLHINLDLSDMLDEESQVDGFLSGLWSNGCKDEICWDARKFVSKLDEDESDTVACFSQSYGPEHVSQIVYKLVGYDGMHMRRWKTLGIFLPRNGRDVREIWELFSGRTPQLTELLVSGKCLSQTWLVSSNKRPVSLPDLSSLEALTLQTGVVKDIDFLRLTFPSVKRLDLAMDISRCSQLSRFTSLEYLDVLFRGTSVAHAEKAIHLPSLKDLAFHVYGLTGVEWHVPVLRTLMITGSLDDESKELPHVQALKVTWELGASVGITTGIEPSLLRTLQEIISKYSETQELSIQVLLKPIWEKFVPGLSEEKRLVLPPVKFI